ncbi:subtype B tannase [Acetobacterium malicum]|uniref:subtype B tannase n=1 Tax=Acetobacterium malicum TaxID=52692 RepID=UPI0004105038|nr:subtype B tannase [Acetobacterium dehalogenans]MBU4539959.1 alpha/beta hydrolase [Bacillota bacterium]
MEYRLEFNANNYTIKTLSLATQTIMYRAYEKIVYVKKPVDINYQIMNIYVLEAYYNGKTINGYTTETAPIFFENAVYGYLPAKPASPDQTYIPDEYRDDITYQSTNDLSQNSLAVALSKGYVVVTPGVRGRTTQDESGKYTGKAPACIVDLKAVVRYLRYNAVIVPGNVEKIIANGISAGGALSSLLGATGNSKDYEPYLRSLGAADARDDIFAASCYCPITNLDNADLAYEWLFYGISNYTGTTGQGKMTADQIRVSEKLKVMFPAYVNSLGLKNDSGTELTLDADGNGNFKDYVKCFIISSAQKAMDSGTDLSTLPWLIITGEQITDIDFGKFIEYATRMKPTAAFDGLDLSNDENDLFGTANVKAQHFSQFAWENSTSDASLADPSIVKMMNPMNYIVAEETSIAKHWRIRHGTVDRDTALAIPIILATMLQNKGIDVDFELSWDKGHDGDYDLDDLFDWIVSICAEK